MASRVSPSVNRLYSGMHFADAFKSSLFLASPFHQEIQPHAYRLSEYT